MSTNPIANSRASSSELLHAIKLAFHVHSGQSDKTGETFFSHCKRVADTVYGDDQRTVAYLHDVVEKGENWTLERLLQEGFHPVIVDAVDALTHRSGESDEAFVKRAAANGIARPVKVADLQDNLQQALAAGLDASKYESGLSIIESLSNRRG
ncbi:hypothetical protein JNB88_32690 [Rhizobium cauense]|nr:hypothetical protein [Rhizobium cauense]MBW9118361.1 hypothetical protein [Rhizobium cauense]